MRCSADTVVSDTEQTNDEILPPNFFICGFVLNYVVLADEQAGGLNNGVQVLSADKLAGITRSTEGNYCSNVSRLVPSKRWMRFAVQVARPWLLWS